MARHHDIVREAGHSERISYRPDLAWMEAEAGTRVSVAPRDESQPDADTAVFVAHEPIEGLPVDVRYVGRSHWLPGDAIERTAGTEPHSGLTIEYVRAGEGELTCAGRTCHLQPGSVYLLHPEQPHMYRAVSRGVFEKHYVILWRGATERVVEHLGLRAHTVVELAQREREAIEGIFTELTQLGAELDATTVRRRSALCYELLLVVADAASGMLKPEPLPERLDRAVQFAMAHLGDQLSVPKLAEEAGCSPAHLTRLFERHLGLHAHQWLERTRMTRAAYLLQHTTAPVYRIAEEYGYHDQYYFSASFKRVTGMSPTQWRKKGRR